MAPRVLVFGSVNLDLVYRVDRLPRPGETVLGGDLVRLSGGKGGNQAHTSARVLGDGRTLFVGCVGDDPEGERLLHDLEAAGVDTSGVVRVIAPSGTAIIAVDDGGENTIAVLPGANRAWPSDAVERAPLAAGDVVVAQLEIPLRIVDAALTRARDAGATTVLNAAPLDPDAIALLDRVDVLVVNEGEAAELFGFANEIDEAEIARTREVFAGDLVVTLGADGAIVAPRDGGLDRVPAIPVDAIDTVGAGDAFVGGLAAALADGATVREAVRVGAAAGALAATVVGARHPSLDRAAIDALLR